MIHSVTLGRKSRPSRGRKKRGVRPSGETNVITTCRLSLTMTRNISRLPFGDHLGRFVCLGLGCNVGFTYLLAIVCSPLNLQCIRQVACRDTTPSSSTSLPPSWCLWKLIDDSINGLPRLQRGWHARPLDLHLRHLLVTASDHAFLHNLTWLYCQNTISSIGRQLVTYRVLGSQGFFQLRNMYHWMNLS